MGGNKAMTVEHDESFTEAAGYITVKRTTYVRIGKLRIPIKRKVEKFQNRVDKRQSL
jgi:hypothetical protein